MPHPIWHENKKNHDLKLSVHIKKTINSYEDWELVTLFYGALHLVDKYLGEHPLNLNPSDHEDRKNYIDRYLRDIRKEYRFIKELSEDARYEKDLSPYDFIQFLISYGKVVKYLTPKKCSFCGTDNRLNKSSCIICHRPL
jgi:hypothetical protein